MNYEKQSWCKIIIHLRGYIIINFSSIGRLVSAAGNLRRKKRLSSFIPIKKIDKSTHHIRVLNNN